jgi:soluble lytic murein transglycosylase-like protein
MVVTAKTLCLAIMANSALYGASSAARACSYSDTIVKEATKNKIDPFIFASMLHVESNWKPHLTSSAGACGIAQVMPQWSKYTCKQLKDPKTGMKEGAKKLHYWIYKYAKGNISVGLCGYNAGFRCKGKNPNRHGVRYAKKVLRIAKKFKRKAK